MRTVKLLFPILILFACTKKESATEKPTLDGVCGYVTGQEMEEALGVVLTEAPSGIFEEYLGGKGCSYSGVKQDTEAHFGYIIFTTAEEFEKARVGKPTDGVGDEAYTINGPDAQQLWVRQEDRYVMVAIGDEPRPKQSAQLAKLVLERLKSKPLNN